MNNIKIIIFFVFMVFVSNSSFSKNIYETDFHHIEVTTNDASKTKLEEIDKIIIKSFLNILDQILLTEDFNYLIQETPYEEFIDTTLQNIIIENELITNNKYIADIKINFRKKDIISLIRNNSLNYSDIFSNPFLLLSTYNEEFTTYGLSKKNIFYNINKLTLEAKNKLLTIKIPKLNPNDRFIISYSDIINDNIINFSNIAKKYNVEDIFIIQISKLKNNYFNIKIYNYSNYKKNILLISDSNLYDINKLQNYVISNLNNWWKKNHLINTNIINQIICKIDSYNYSDLITIKNKIANLSQFKSINPTVISYNNNIEKIEFYGDYPVFFKSLLLNNIAIITKETCTITSIK